MFSAVDAYDRHVGRYSGELGRRLIAAAALKPGDRALDVGCGPGGLTRELVMLLGEDHVAAVEPSPAFAAAAQQRFPTVDIRNTGAEELPFADASFDAALAQLVINFMADAHKGVGQMRRVVRPGGAVVAAVWDYGGGMTMLRTFWDAANELDPGSQAKHERNMGYSTPESLAELWEDCGLAEVSAGPVGVSASYDNFDDLWFGFAQGVGPAGAYLVGLEADERERLKGALRERLGVADEPFDLTARAWMVTGRVP